MRNNKARLLAETQRLKDLESQYAEKFDAMGNKIRNN